ncbi:MAG: hypothetical protein ACI4JB_00945 [Porcipelethomonas sp.]
MELFELLGKIAVEGADEAKRDIDGVASFAEKKAAELYDALGKISGSAAAFQPDSINIRTGKTEYAGGVQTSGSMGGIGAYGNAAHIEQPVVKLPELKLPEYDTGFSGTFEQALKKVETLCGRMGSAFDTAYDTASMGKLSSVFSDIAEKIGMVNRAYEKSPDYAQAAASAFDAAAKSAEESGAVYEKNTAAADRAAEAADITSEKIAGIGKAYETGFAAAENAAGKIPGIAEKIAGAERAYSDSGSAARNAAADISGVADRIMSFGQAYDGGFYSVKNAAGEIAGIADRIMGIGSACQDSKKAAEDAGNAISGYCTKAKNISGISETVYSSSEKVSGIISKITEGIIAAENSGSQSLQRQRENISDEMNLMETAVSRGMSGISSKQLSILGSLYSRNQQQWDRIGSAGYSGISKMAAGVNAAAPLVIAACSQVAGSSLNSLSIDGRSAGAYLMDTFKSGLAAKAASVYSTVASIASDISGIMSKITFSVSSIADVSSLTGHAEGGIVTREHIARVGEDGAEAIIPLEKNTEWIDRVAERISGGTGNSAVLDKLTELNENIKNLRIYLDGKTLVGEIAPAMDGALGSIARRKRRSGA